VNIDSKDSSMLNNYKTRRWEGKSVCVLAATLFMFGDWAVLCVQALMSLCHKSGLLACMLNDAVRWYVLRRIDTLYFISI